MSELDIDDERRLDAAQGWLGLGNCVEAQAELEQISSPMQSHPDVLFVRWGICAQAEKWEHAAEVARVITELVPDNSFGWIHLAYALHEMKRTKEAWNALLPVADKFSGEPIVCYNLACYACQLGNRGEALQWLARAGAIAGEKQIRLEALQDPDFEPLWKEIGEMPK